VVQGLIILFNIVYQAAGQVKDLKMPKNMIDMFSVMDVLKTYRVEPENSKPSALVVFLHGLGADGQDLISLAQPFSESLPDAAFVSPNAPFHCDMAPMGYQWFSLQEWTTESILHGVQEAAPILDNFLDEQLSHYGLDDSRLAIVGFSQGTMMSLYVAPRRKKKIAAVLGYSGALVWEDQVSYETLAKPPVMLIHGSVDPVVPVEAYHHARHTLEQAGFEVSGGITQGLMHGIDPQGVDQGRKFLKKALAAQAG
jgi:phospholipase/carboxylesterase